MLEPNSLAAVTATAGAVAAIEKVSSNLVDRISLKFAKDGYEVLKFKLNKGLPTYLTALYAKCQTIKTLLNRNDPLPLESCFVAPDFQVRESSVEADPFLREIYASGGKFVITGLAGSGKSIFLKYTFRRSLELGHTYYPIFFELRTLNRSDPKSDLLIESLFLSICEYCESFTRVQFNYGLRSGAFYLLLDGFDELNRTIREQVAAEINHLAKKYPDCIFLVTSRPSDEFISWDSFTEAQLQPFDLDKASTYISKLKFDEEKKQIFLDDLHNGLFEKNTGFLSNPLLAAMMLLTYDSFGEIPEKKYLFYAKAFEVLSREHDNSKGRYKRHLFSALTMEDIEKLFMYFCAFSYTERVFSFSDIQMTEFVKKSLGASSLDALPEDVVHDFRESISIMERVGLYYEFAHRSFQEYFYAKFVVSDRRIALEKKIGWLTASFASDDAVEMIAEMDRTYFEDDFLLPSARRVYAQISAADPISNPAGILSKFYSEVHTGLDRSSDLEGEVKKEVYYTIRNNGKHFLLRQAFNRYKKELADAFAPAKIERSISSESAADILDAEYGGGFRILYSNNSKIAKIGGDSYASQIKFALHCLLKHLERKASSRKAGISAIMERALLRDSPDKVVVRQALKKR